MECLSHEYFKEPVLWLDSRSNKLDFIPSGFTHKTTQEAVCIQHWKIKHLVKEALGNKTHRTTLGGSFQSGIRSFSARRANNAVRTSSPRLKEVKEIHSSMMETGSGFQQLDMKNLMDMYAKCGSMVDARHLFDNIPKHDVLSWNIMISGYAKREEGGLALELYAQMHKQGVQPTGQTLVSAVKACTSLAKLEEGKQVNGILVKVGCLEKGRTIHAQALKTDFQTNVFVGTTLIKMYVNCGSMEDARHVFDGLPHRDVISWNTMIWGYAEKEQGEVALQLYACMYREDVQPSCRTFVGAIKACCCLAALEEGKQVDGMFLKRGCLEKGKAIHAQVLKTRLEFNVYVGTTLVKMYARSGSMEDAQSVFDTLPHRDVVSWTAMILGYAENEKGRVALDFFEQMHWEGVIPDHRAFVGALKACSSLAAQEEGLQVDQKLVKIDSLEKARAINSQVVKCGFESSVFVGNVLVHMYTKCGSMEDARHVFDKLPYSDVVSWNAMILGYAEREEGEVALGLYAQMQQQGVIPDHRTFVSALKACSSLAAMKEGNQLEGRLVIIGCLEKGRAIHSRLVKCGFESDVFVGNSLVHMYAKCGNMEDSWHVFHELPHCDVVSWNAIILGYAEKEEGVRALDLLAHMQQRGVKPDHRTFLGALKACSSLAALEERNQVGGKLVRIASVQRGRAIHGQIVKRGFESNAFLGDTLVHMYTECGSMEDARHIFDTLPRLDAVSWNAMILGYAENEEGEVALDLYARMRQECFIPDHIIFVGILKACSSLTASEEGKQVDGKLVKIGCMEKGRAIHSQVVEGGFESNVFVGTTLVHMYTKCGSMEDAHHVFNKLPHRAVNSWSAMILGYAEQDGSEEAFKLFAQMQEQGLTADTGTFLGILKACANTAALDTGKEIHNQICKLELETNAVLANTLIDMYGRCGSMVDAQRLFDTLQRRDVVTWNALIAGYARQGDSGLVFCLFEGMEQEGMQPNGVTFIIVLSLCSHAGLVEKGHKYFQAMIAHFGVRAGIEHYNCMVDLLGRAGQVNEAVEFVENMPCQPDLVAWLSILGACRQWENVEVGKYAFEHAVRLDERHPAAYILMSNIYACAYMWEDCDKIQEKKRKASCMQDITTGVVCIHHGG